MSRKSPPLTILMLMLAALALSACSLINPAPEPTVDPNTPVEATPGEPPTSTPAAPAGGGDNSAPIPALVDSIDILLLESFPIQINVVVTGNLRNGCSVLAGAVQTNLANNVIQLEVLETQTGAEACGQALVPFTETYPLDVDGLPAGDYTVTVNGVTGTFTFTVDNIIPEEARPTPAPIVNTATITTAEVQVIENVPLTYGLIVTGDLPDGCTELILPATLTVEDDTIIVDLLTTRPAEELCTQVLVPYTEVIPLNLSAPAGSYTVIINDVTAEGMFEKAAETVDGIPASCVLQGDGDALFFDPQLGFCFRYPRTFAIGDVLADPAAVGVYGPPLDDNPVEPVFVGLNIVIDGAADGQAAAEFAANAIREANVGNSVTISEITIGGFPAEVVEGLPGRTGNRQAFLVANDTIYVFVLYPVDDTFPAAQADIDLVWPLVTGSFAFLTPDLTARFDSCPTPTLDTTLYVDPIGGVCFLYPVTFDRSANLGENSSIAVFLGGNFTPVTDPVRGTLFLDVTPAADGATLTDAVDAALADFTGLDGLSRTPFSLGGQPAEIVDGIPGANATRQIYVLANGKVYTFVLQPLEVTETNVRGDVELVYNTAISSVVFVP